MYDICAHLCVVCPHPLSSPCPEYKFLRAGVFFLSVLCSVFRVQNYTWHMERTKTNKQTNKPKNLVKCLGRTNFALSFIFICIPFISSNEHTLLLYKERIATCSFCLPFIWVYIFCVCVKIMAINLSWVVREEKAVPCFAKGGKQVQFLVVKRIRNFVWQGLDTQITTMSLLLLGYPWFWFHY